MQQFLPAVVASVKCSEFLSQLVIYFLLKFEVCGLITY